MSELTDYINQTGPAVVAARLRALPAWAMFNAMWKSPADLIPLADAMGFQTLADVNAWVQASLTLPKADIFLKQALAQSTQVHEPFFVSDWPAMDLAIAQQCVRASDFSRKNWDDIYRVPTLAQLEKMARECYSHRFAGKGQDMDCDDFVRISSGWLSANGLGNVATGPCVIRLFKNDQFLNSHVVRLCLTKETPTPGLTCHWWETETGTIYPISFTQFAGTDANRAEVFFCEF